MLDTGMESWDPFSDWRGDFVSLLTASSEWLFSNDSSCFVADSFEFCSVLIAAKGLENILKQHVCFPVSKAKLLMKRSLCIQSQLLMD